MQAQPGTKVCLLATVALALSWFAPNVALAYPTYPATIPNGTTLGCITCHFAAGGGGPRNPFGEAYAAAGRRWTQALAEADSDNDGYSNGVELGDPFFTWTAGSSTPPAYAPRAPGSNVGSDGADMDECTLGIDECAMSAMCVDETGPASQRPETYRCICPPGYTGDGHSPGTGCTRIVEPPPPLGGGGIPELRAATQVGEGQWTWVNTSGEDTAPVETSCGRTGRDQWFYYPYECNGPVVIEREGFNYVPVVSLYESGAYNAEGFETPPAPRERRCFTSATHDGPEIRTTEGAFLVRFSGINGAAGSGRFRIRCEATLGSGYCSSASSLPEETPTRYTLGQTREPRISGTPPQDPCPLPGDVWFDYVPTCSGQAEVTLSGYDDVRCDNTRTWGVAAYRGDTCENLMEQPSGCSAAAPVAPTGTGCANATRTLAFGVLAGESYRLRVGGSNTHSGSIRVTCTPSPMCNQVNGVETNCHPQATCVPGTADPLSAPQCVCRPGYAGDGLQTDLGGSGCEPVVCANAGNACDEEATCSLASGTCSCNSGYTNAGSAAPGTACVDQNECAASNTCTGGSACRNRTGPRPDGLGYDCVCQTGLSVPDGDTQCRAVCGDGLMHPHGSASGPDNVRPPEACDDGNDIDGDGCSSTCTLEGTHTCTVTPYMRSVCSPGRCGNGIVNPTAQSNGPGDTWGAETCDDGNLTAGDGCSPSCILEGTHRCDIVNMRTYCVLGACGDGVVQPGLGEECDWAAGQSTTCSENCTLPPPPPMASCQVEPTSRLQPFFWLGCLGLTFGGVVFRGRRRRVREEPS